MPIESSIAILFISSDLLILTAVLLQMLMRQDVGDGAGQRRGFTDFAFPRRVAETHRKMFPGSRKRICAKVLMGTGSLLLITCIVLWLLRRVFYP